MPAPEKTTKAAASSAQLKDRFFRKPGEGFFDTKGNTFFRKQGESFFNSKSTFFPVQKKISVNEPGDAHEKEADAVADKVIRMPAVAKAAQPAITSKKQVSRCRKKKKSPMKTGCR